MISAGATPKAVQTVMGHASAAFSLTVYGHLFDKDLDALAERMDTPNGRVPTAPRHARGMSHVEQADTDASRIADLQ
jgi:hypothetical protein